MNPKFSTVKIKCKPLVKTFLANNFGTPVAIPERHILYRYAYSQLFKHNTKPFTDDQGELKQYTEEIMLSISFNSFRYSGFQINEKNTQFFNDSVNQYMRDLWRTNLDSLMISQEKQTAWKEKFLDLVALAKGIKANSNTAELIRTLKQELSEHEITIKKAIDHVIVDTLNLSPDDLDYETIKRDYHRYRFPELYEQALKRDSERKLKKSVPLLSPQYNLFSGSDSIN